MQCVAVCRDVLIVKALHRALASNLDLEFLIGDRTAARRLESAGIQARVADPRKQQSYLEAGLTPTTCVIVEDDGTRDLRPVLEAVTGAGATLVYVLSSGERSPSRTDAWRSIFPDVTVLSIGHLLQDSLLTALGRSLTRARVQQYQRYFAGADRILILLHNDPDPDAMASGLALRNLLHRTKTTAIIGAFHGVTRPENLRMANLLDIKVEKVTAESLTQYTKIATVDVQPHYFGGLIHRVDLVVDHHPAREGYTAAFKGHPPGLRFDGDHPHGTHAVGRRERIGADGHGNAVRDQIGHAIPQPPHAPRGPRCVHVPLSTGERRSRAQDGRCGNHD